jgi:CubicO group peptidase (beta-lactamase class C family)
VTALALLACAPALPAQATLRPGARASLDSVVDWLVAREFLPGIAVAIVSGDQVIYRRNAGWADREAQRRVDANTVFYIASTTKPMTALATTLLDRHRIIDLDATVSQLLPDATFGAGVDPSRITVRQLLSHTHGINGNGPVSYRAAYSGEIERAAMMRALASHGATQGGTAFLYNNFGYNLLSLAIDSIARKPWQDVLAERVFRPAGMRSTTARVSEIPRDRLAMPYAASPDGLARIPYAKTDNNMQAAGGVVTTAADLARLVIAELNGGRIDGRQVFPADVIAETQRPVATFSQNMGGIPRFAYALGWQHGIGR